MSYLHCPTCNRAYNLATTAVCPFCPVPATEVDATEDLVAAAERLASAMARATPAERAAAAARMDQLALPAPGGVVVPVAIREILAPRRVPPPPPEPPHLVARVISLMERIAPRLPAPKIVRRAASLMRLLAA